MRLSLFRSRWTIAVAAAASVAIVGFIAFLWSKSDRDAHVAESREDTATESVLAPAEDVSSGTESVHVAVVTPRTGGLALSDTEPATVEAFDWAELYAKVSGYLKAQSVDIGDTVKVGQVLARIDAPELVEAVDEAQAELAQAMAQVQLMQMALERAKADVTAAQAGVREKQADSERARAYLEYRRIQFDRISRLAKARAVEDKLLDETRQERDAAQATESVAQAAIRTAQADVGAKQAKVAQADADLSNARAKVQVAAAAQKKAEVFLDYTNILSPYDGVVTLRSYHIGDFIRAADQGGRTPLLTVARIDVMRVVARIPERYVPFTDRGDPALIELDALPGQKLTGKISRVANSVDRVDKTMRVEIDLKNSSNQLRDGMFGRVTIQLTQSTKDLTVPSTSLIADQNGKGFSVLVVRERHVHKCRVKVARDNGNQAEIQTGLQPDDLVVRHPTDELTEGASVQPVIGDDPSPNPANVRR